jgi:carbon-monoxide dehydrogenase medium subunit
MTTVQTIAEFTYKTPRTLDEALRLLEQGKAGARILAGGTDLVLQMKQRLLTPSLVIDIKNVPDLDRLDWSEKGGLHIGASVSISKLLALEVLLKRFSVLAQACRVIGSTQIKNRATLGGNICNAAPSADSAPALLCLGASGILKRSGGTRTISLEEFFKSPGKTAVRDNELLVEIDVPTPPANSAGCYLRHTTREEMDISVVGVASYLELSPDKKVKTARITLAAVAPVPMRAHQAESILQGKAVTADAIEAAAVKAAAEASPITDMRGSAEYRREIVKVLTRRTLKKCGEDLGLKL